MHKLGDVRNKTQSSKVLSCKINFEIKDFSTYSSILFK